VHACHPIGCAVGSGPRDHLQQSRNAYQSKGDYQRAIQDYDEAIRIDPDSALAFNNRGSAFQHMGNYARAIQDYDQAIRLGWELRPFLQQSRSRAYLNEDYAQAIKLWRSLESIPTIPASTTAAWLASTRVFFIAAVPDFVRAVQIDPAKPYRVLALYLARLAAVTRTERCSRRMPPSSSHAMARPVVSLLLGQHPQAVLNAASRPDPQVQRERQCERTST